MIKHFHKALSQLRCRFNWIAHPLQAIPRKTHNRIAYTVLALWTTLQAYTILCAFRDGRLTRHNAAVIAFIIACGMSNRLNGGMMLGVICYALLGSPALAVAVCGIYWLLRNGDLIEHAVRRLERC